MKRPILLSLMMLCLGGVLAQSWPLEGSQLHYRLIGFKFPLAEGATLYTVQIAKGTYYSEDSFKKHTINSFCGSVTKILGDVSDWNQNYTWRVVYKKENKVALRGELHHFSTIKVHRLDTSKNHFVIKHKAEKFKDAFVFVDACRTLFDMDGNPVWYLPNIDGIVDDTSTIRDLKLSPSGNITFIVAHKTGGIACEIDYNAKVLWLAPGKTIIKGDTMEMLYHHDFTSFANGRYMALVNENLQTEWRFTSTQDSGLYIASKHGEKNLVSKRLWKQIPFGEIIEYDKYGTAVWSWKSSEYYKDSNLVNHKYIVKNHLTPWVDTLDDHINAFFLDEKKSCVYLSFRNLSKLLKIEYPSGEIIGSYNYRFVYDTDTVSNPSFLFSGQHSIKVADNGNIYLFNNNDADAGGLPKIAVYKENETKSGILEKTWEYTYPLDISENLPKNLSRKNKPRVTSGGNVVELPGQAMFVSMCIPYKEMYIVSNDKKILWEGYFESYITSKGRWLEFPTYRASIVKNKREMEKLIFKPSDMH